MAHKGVPAIFLDRDGVINRLVTERGPKETPLTPDEFELLPSVKKAITMMKKAGACIIVVTNQPNVAKGKTTLQLHRAIEQRMHTVLGKQSAVDGVYTCLHHPDTSQVIVPELLKDCECRKPKPGLLLQAAKDHSIDLRKSVMVGDSMTDIEAGKRAGCKTMLIVGESHTKAPLKNTGTIPDAVAGSLLDAVPYVLRYIPRRMEISFKI